MLMPPTICFVQTIQGLPAPSVDPRVGEIHGFLITCNTVCMHIGICVCMHACVCMYMPVCNGESDSTHYIGFDLCFKMAAQKITIYISAKTHFRAYQSPKQWVVSTDCNPKHSTVP